MRMTLEELREQRGNLREAARRYYESFTDIRYCITLVPDDPDYPYRVTKVGINPHTSQYERMYMTLAPNMEPYLCAPSLKEAKRMVKTFTRYQWVSV